MDPYVVCLLIGSGIAYTLMLRTEKKGELFAKWEETDPHDLYVERVKLFKASKNTMLTAAVLSFLMLVFF